MPTLFLIVYVLLWFGTGVISYLYFKKIGVVLGFYLSLLYGLSGIVSIWIVNQNLYYASNIYKYDIISVSPLIYLWVTVLLYSMPLFIFRVDKIEFIFLTPNQNPYEIKLKKICIDILIGVFFFLSVVVFISIVSGLFNLSEVLKIDAGSLNKDEYQVEFQEKAFSTPLQYWGYRVWKMMCSTMVCFAFYKSFCKRRKTIAIGLFFCSCLLPILVGIVNNSRQQILCSLMVFFISYQLFKNKISIRNRQKILKISILFVFIFAIFFVWISVLRFGDDSNYVLFGLLRYFGESPLNFASELFYHQERLLYGYNSFPSFFHVSNEIRRQMTQQIGGVLGYIFYTFIGNFVIDFGKCFVLLFGCVVAFISFLLKYFRVSKSYATVGKIILIQTFAIISFQGIFFFTYAINPYSFIFSIVLFLFLNTKISRPEIRKPLT